MQKYKHGASLKHYYSPVQQLKCHKGFFILLHFHLCNTCKIYLNISDTKIWPKAKCHDRLSSTSGLFGQTTRLHIKDLRSWKHQLNVVTQLQSLCDILNKRGGGVRGGGGCSLFSWCSNKNQLFEKLSSQSWSPEQWISSFLSTFP